LNTDIRKFESSQKDESRAQSADYSKAVVLNLFCLIYPLTKSTNLFCPNNVWCVKSYPTL